jgi:hypothetical protein
VTVYALHHPDGRWLYSLPAPKEANNFHARPTQAMHADGQPMDHIQGAWWATDHEATELKWIGVARKKTTHYRLKDVAAESVRYPGILTLEQWEERSDREGDTLWDLYTNVTVDEDAPVHVYDGPITVLEGREPPGPDELPWVANLPQALTGRPEYLHLVPGRIPNLRKHIDKLIERMPRVRHCFDGYDGYTGLHIVLDVPYDQPRTRWQRDISHRTGKPLKSGHNVRVLARRELNLPVPADVVADNYETALRMWEEQVEFWTGIVTSASVAACSACDGTGHVPHGADQYTPSSKP